jgi:hypothetical protein
MKGPDGVAAHVCIDVSPRCLSAAKGDRVEGSLEEMAAIHSLYLRDAKDHADFIKLYTETTTVHLTPDA